MTELAALHDVRNPASCRVAQKAGYRFVRALDAPPPSSGQGHLHIRTSAARSFLSGPDAPAARP